MARKSPGSCRRFLMTMFDLTGRVAVVTGGNGGIGLGMARGLAASGASVVVAARNAEKAEAAVAELGAQSTFIALDVADESWKSGLAGSTSSSTTPGPRSASRPRPTPRPNGMPCSTPT